MVKMTEDDRTDHAQLSQMILERSVLWDSFAAGDVVPLRESQSFLKKKTKHLHQLNNKTCRPTW